jgi:hypothetical protein
MAQSGRVVRGTPLRDATRLQAKLLWGSKPDVGFGGFDWQSS